MIIKKYFMKSVNRITKDFKQKELLPLKLVFFVQASTISVLYPYLTIHMRELGINVEEAAIMSAVIPVIGILMPPLAGMVADKIGNFKLLLALFSFIGGAAALLLLLVPVGRITVQYPERVTLDFGCRGLGDAKTDDLGPGRFRLGFSSEIPCDQIQRQNASDSGSFDLDARLEGCGFVCRSSAEASGRRSEFLTGEDSEAPKDPILAGRSYAIRILTETGAKTHLYNLTKDEVPQTRTKEDALSHRVMANDENLDKSIRRLAPSEYFFPASGLSHLNCRRVPSDGEGVYSCVVGAPEEVLPVTNASLKLRLKEAEGDEFDRFQSDSLALDSDESLPVTCENPEPEGKEDISASVYLHDPENNLRVVETLSLSQCRPICLLSAARKDMCTNLKKEVFYDPNLTFWTYLVIRVFIGIIGSTSYAMYEVAVIAILREQKADYGLQRIYASIGGMISSPLSGMLIDYASQGKGYTDFRPAFYLYAGLKTGTSILMLFINLEFKQAASNVLADAIQVLKNLEIIALLAVCFVFGAAWGYIESFLFWFLEDLGGTRSLMGITITVGGIAGIPLLVLSGPIIDKIGHANVLIIGFLFYAIRLVGYSIIYNPYHCLYFEAMESITSSLAITAAITYAAKLSTTTTDGSVQGLVGGFYFGVGRGAGSLIGGYLMKAFGTRETYRILAVFCILTGSAYYLFNKFYIGKRPQTEGNEICKKEPKIKSNLEPDLKIITDKPKMEETENNNTTLEKMAKDNEGYEASEEEKKETEEKDKKSDAEHVPDGEAIAQNEEEMKKKD